MDTTPVSLLQRLREDNDPKDWSDFISLFTPLLCRWAQEMRMPSQEAEDMIQEVFTTLLR